MERWEVEAAWRCFLRGLGDFSTVLCGYRCFSGKRGTHCQVQEAVCCAGSARGARVRNEPGLGVPRRGAAAFLGYMGVQTEASEKESSGLVGMMGII